jgi:hypothetical protein
MMPPCQDAGNATIADHPAHCFGIKLPALRHLSDRKEVGVFCVLLPPLDAFVVAYCFSGYTQELGFVVIEPLLQGSAHGGSKEG